MKTIEEKDQSPAISKFKVKPYSEAIYRANMEVMEPGMEAYLNGFTETPIAIEADIKIKGLKNPMYLVVIGFSTMHVLESARRLDKEIFNVLVIEPDISTFKATLGREYIGHLIKDPTIDFIVGVPLEQLGVELFKTFAKQDEKSGPRPSKCLQPEIICDPFVYGPIDNKQNPVAEEIIKVVQDSAKQVFLSMGCSSDTFSRWEQTMRNEKNLQDCYKIGSLFDKFEDIPAIVVGAGPSLEELIDIHKQYDINDKAVIISCDASLHRLLSEGIRPHIVTRCERKFTTIFNKIRKEDTKDVFYAGYSWTPPEFFELFDNKFMVFRDNGVNKWTGYDPGSVNGGVSSANAALEIAFLLGCKNIFLTGIDLCFKDGKSHAQGAEIEFDVEKSKPKWTHIEGNNGDVVTTIPVWFRCLQEYRQALVRHEKRKVSVINTSTIGAKIEGANHASWSEAISFLNEKKAPLQRIKDNLQIHDGTYKASLTEKKAKTVVFLKKLRDDLEKFFLYIDDAMKVGSSEEYKIVEQLKSHTEPAVFFSNIQNIQRSLEEMYKEPCRQIEVFKQKYYSQREFSELILDTCQLDLFHTENKMNGLYNLIPVEFERRKTFVAIHTMLFRLFNFYANKMISLFENGPEQITYLPEKEVLLPDDENKDNLKTHFKKTRKILSSDDLIRERLKQSYTKKAGVINTYDN